MGQPWPQPDLGKLEPISPSRGASGSTPTQEPGFNGYMRCPLPTPIVTDSDGLRQFYRGQIPQYRIIPAATPPH